MDNREKLDDDGIDYSHLFAVVKEINLVDYLSEPNPIDPINEANKFFPSGIIGSLNENDERNYIVLVHTMKQTLSRIMNEATVQSKNNSILGMLRATFIEGSFNNNRTMSVVEIVRIKVDETNNFRWKVHPLIVN